jgi:hypothetical protein
MPRFYFDVREGSNFIRDPEGQLMRDIEAAQYEAEEVGVSIARDSLLSGRARAVTVEVSDKKRQPVLAVTVSIEISRPSKNVLAFCGGL